jgi:hypothetical protein
VLLFPSDSVVAPGVREALEEGGIEVSLISALAELPKQPIHQAVALNVAGCGEFPAQRQRVRETLEQLHARYGDLPLILIDSSLADGASYGWAAGYDARVCWPGAVDLPGLVRQVVRSHKRAESSED